MIMTKISKSLILFKYVNKQINIFLIIKIKYIMYDYYIVIITYMNYNLNYLNI